MRFLRTTAGYRKTDQTETKQYINTQVKVLFWVVVPCPRKNSSVSNWLHHMGKLDKRESVEKFHVGSDIRSINHKTKWSIFKVRCIIEISVMKENLSGWKNVQIPHDSDISKFYCNMIH
jgi:hypothetical protein